MDWLFKIGDKVHPDHPAYRLKWRDGQLVHFRPDGFYTGKRELQGFL